MSWILKKNFFQTRLYKFLDKLVGFDNYSKNKNHDKNAFLTEVQDIKRVEMIRNAY